MELLIGIITKDGTVKTDDGREFEIGSRGVDKEGYPEVIIDAKKVGGDGWMHRQSVKPYVGMRCSFVIYNGKHGDNYEVLPQ
jgi:hypothetical protein